jgi:stage III sporulation protein AH
MSVNKQTVWLVTMLSVMVVLSAYYIVTGPVEPAEQVAQTAKEKQGDIKVDIKPVDEPSSSGEKSAEVLENQSNDFFVGYQLQRSTLRQKMVEEYMQVLTNPEAPEKEVEEANQKIQQLMKIDNQETVLEELIRKEGYLPHVDVIVQSEKLDKKQVVKLISLVRQHLQVDPHHVTVAYR